MTGLSATAADLREAIERSGYYPALVVEAVEAALGEEEVVSYLVHQETTFDRDEVLRHVTVLVLTPTRVVASHTDEHGPEEGAPPHATTATETVRRDAVTSVVVNRVVDNPTSHRPGALPREVVVTVAWGGMSRLDLEPASCSDPTCEADHGYTGTLGADDLALRVSAPADGQDAVAQALAFAAALSAGLSRPGASFRAP